MKVFFDTEFTGLQNGTELISIGMISENNKIFYGELTDYDQKYLSPWIKENVIQNLIQTKINRFEQLPSWINIGDKEYISGALEDYLKQFDTVELVSDVCHYDMVLFADLFGGAMYIPHNVAPVCIDICQMFSKAMKIPMQEAFDMSREAYAKTSPEYESSKSLLYATEIAMKHNSLYDALLIQLCYGELIKALKGEYECKCRL